MIYFPSEVTFCEVLRSLLPYEVFWTIVLLKHVRILERNHKPNMSVVKASIIVTNNGLRCSKIFTVNIWAKTAHIFHTHLHSKQSSLHREGLQSVTMYKSVKRNTFWLAWNWHYLAEHNGTSHFLLHFWQNTVISYSRAESPKKCMLCGWFWSSLALNSVVIQLKPCWTSLHLGRLSMGWTVSLSISFHPSSILQTK